MCARAPKGDTHDPSFGKGFLYIFNVFYYNFIINN